ncbi:hypothetical protein OF829_12735 [Sphingomonas sp. LB-2]|uniref:hypothetical protein n=1 Tax=Sphingomonas caeni TaxID=2984949 RepID=UPI0022324920|nr:hypothetical protein [Sphingomonas caeni]MCW3848109.1 hypothetical protein [Sphingomonas caeni]
MNWDRVNVWTSTLYALIQSLSLAKEQQFGDLESLPTRIKEADSWLPAGWSYSSSLATQPMGTKRVKARRDPNKHFEFIVRQVIQMLIQDLVVIMDGMMDDILAVRGEAAGDFPTSKVQKLATHLDPKYNWAKHGCFELIAARNVLCHAGGKWNQRSIDLVSGFVSSPPNVGDRLEIGFACLFQFRKAMRTFLNEVKLP